MAAVTLSQRPHSHQDTSSDPADDDITSLSGSDFTLYSDEALSDEIGDVSDPDSSRPDTSMWSGSINQHLDLHSYNGGGSRTFGNSDVKL